MQVFLNDGGPLIAFAVETADDWRGAEDSTTPGASPRGTSDYSRACAADSPAGLLAVGAGTGVVIGAQEGVATAWWFDDTPDALYLIGCIYGDDAADALLQSTLHTTAPDRWNPLGGMQVGTPLLALIHAGSVGAELTLRPPEDRVLIGEILPTTLAIGAYDVAASEFRSQAGLYNVVRWVRR